MQRWCHECRVEFGDFYICPSCRPTVEARDYPGHLPNIHGIRTNIQKGSELTARGIAYYRSIGHTVSDDGVHTLGECRV